jgi:hypothetical protein
MASDRLDPTQMTQCIIMLEHTQGTQLVEPLQPYCFQPLKNILLHCFWALMKNQVLFCVDWAAQQMG